MDVYVVAFTFKLCKSFWQLALLLAKPLFEFARDAMRATHAFWENSFDLKILECETWNIRLMHILNHLSAIYLDIFL